MFTALIFYQVLVTVFNTTANTDFRSNAYKIVKENLASLQEDSLLSALCHPRVLRTCLDLIQENISSSRINIVEAGASHGRMFSQLIPIVNSQLLNEVKC